MKEDFDPDDLMADDGIELDDRFTPITNLIDTFHIEFQKDGDCINFVKQLVGITQLWVDDHTEDGGRFKLIVIDPSEETEE